MYQLLLSRVEVDLSRKGAEKMLTEELIRHHFAGIELIPHELTQSNVANNSRRHKRSGYRSVALGNYTRVDTTDDGALYVGVRGIPVPHQGYEIPIMGKNPSSEIAWQIRHCISTVTLSREELTLRGEGLTVHVSPSVHLGGSNRSLLGSSRGDVLPLNAASVLMAFSNMNEIAICELFDLVHYKGCGRSMFVSGKREYDSLFPESSKESPWEHDNIPGLRTSYPIPYLNRTNGWGLSLP